MTGLGFDRANLIVSALIAPAQLRRLSRPDLNLLADHLGGDGSCKKGSFWETIEVGSSELRYFPRGKQDICDSGSSRVTVQ